MRMVSKKSAILAGGHLWDQVSIEGNHSTMVKFTGFSDPGYNSLFLRLNRCIKALPTTIKKSSRPRNGPGTANMSIEQIKNYFELYPVIELPTSIHTYKATLREHFGRLSEPPPTKNIWEPIGEGFRDLNLQSYFHHLYEVYSYPREWIDVYEYIASFELNLVEQGIIREKARIIALNQAVIRQINSQDIYTDEGSLAQEYLGGVEFDFKLGER